MEFRCGNASRDLQFLECLNFGQCQVDSIVGEFCACKDGYTHDVYGFIRSYNCAIPPNFMLIYFIVYSSLSALAFSHAIYQMVKFSGAKGKAINIGRICICWSFAAWMNVVSVYVQDGFYEGAVLTLVLIASIGFPLAAYTYSILLNPIAQRTGSLTMAKWLSFIANTTSLLELIIIYVFTGLVFPHIRDPNPALYNYYMLGFILQAAIALILGCVATFILSYKLNSLVREKVSGSSGFVKQLQAVMVFQIMLIFGALVLFVIALIWISYHSFPVFAVSWMMQNVTLLLLVPLIVPFFSSTSSNTKNTLRSPVSGSAEIEPGSSEQKYYEPHITVHYAKSSTSSRGFRRPFKNANREDLRKMTTITEKGESVNTQVASFSQADSVT
jgi:hypothetical protein